ncbi:hypothetical protein E4U33_005695, partial [Claviceps sp. LM78 group G4]
MPVEEKYTESHASQTKEHPSEEEEASHGDDNAPAPSTRQGIVMASNQVGLGILSLPKVLDVLVGGIPFEIIFGICLFVKICFTCGSATVTISIPSPQYAIQPRGLYGGLCGCGSHRVLATLSATPIQVQALFMDGVGLWASISQLAA